MEEDRIPAPAPVAGAAVPVVGAAYLLLLSCLLFFAISSAAAAHNPSLIWQSLVCYGDRPPSLQSGSAKQALAGYDGYIKQGHNCHLRKKLIDSASFVRNK